MQYHELICHNNTTSRIYLPIIAISHICLTQSSLCCLPCLFSTDSVVHRTVPNSNSIELPPHCHSLCFHHSIANALSSTSSSAFYQHHIWFLTVVTICFRGCIKAVIAIGLSDVFLPIHLLWCQYCTQISCVKCDIDVSITFPHALDIAHVSGEKSSERHVSRFPWERCKIPVDVFQVRFPSVSHSILQQFWVQFWHVDDSLKTIQPSCQTQVWLQDLLLPSFQWLDQKKSLCFAIPLAPWFFIKFALLRA